MERLFLWEQMYGEKVEEADELRLDLQDVKDLYKNQVPNYFEELAKKALFHVNYLYWTFI